MIWSLHAPRRLGELARAGDSLGKVVATQSCVETLLKVALTSAMGSENLGPEGEGIAVGFCIMARAAPRT